MEWIKAIFDVIWSIVNIKLDMFGFDISVFNVIVFATVCGLFWKLLFGGEKKSD